MNFLNSDEAPAAVGEEHHDGVEQHQQSEQGLPCGLTQDRMHHYVGVGHVD